MAKRRSTLPVRRPGPGESSSLASRLLAPALVAAVLLGAFQPLVAQVPQASASIQDDPRVRAASQWLAHVDEGDLDAAWRSASERTREIFPEKAWRSTLVRSGEDEQDRRWAVFGYRAR